MDHTFITILGFVAAFFTTFALLPQGLRAIKTKHTKDLSLPMIVMMEVGIILWLVYGIIIADMPLVFANGIGTIFATINLIMKLRYG
ncbi:MAG: SemiSWEET transporter [Bacteroidetes bacterium]|nr:SemiSWEET transporter [Bacteroidota bacterium]